MKLSKDKKGWQKELDHVLRVFPDAIVSEVSTAYEVFHAIVDGVRLIFYPHTTKGTKNQHLRVRNGTPARKEDFLRLATILGQSKQSSSTFHVNNFWHWHHQEKMRQEGCYPHYWGNADKFRDIAL